MNSAGKVAVLLLLVGIAGCKHKVQSAAPPPPPAQVYPPSAVAKDEPLPQPPEPKPVDVQPPNSAAAQQPPPPKAKKPSHRKKPSDATQTTPAKDTTETPGTSQQASAGQPSATSPIGQLTSGSDSGSTPTRQQIQDSINNTDKGLTEIKHNLSSDEQQTKTQIETFLAKAKKALEQDDLDGANTLVAKAKVLLEELRKGE